MNRFFLFSLGAAGALMLTPRAANAQSTGLLPLRAKIGVLLPSQSAAKDFSGSVVPAGEIDVRIPGLLSGGGFGSTFVTAGYQERSSNGGKLRVIPLTLSRTFSPVNPASAITGNVYFGVGAGAYFLQGRSTTASQSRTTVGGFAQVGYQTPSKFFVEAKYQITAQKAAGLSPSGVLVFVGRSF